jgi:hypothetical protein
MHRSARLTAVTVAALGSACAVGDRYLSRNHAALNPTELG